MKKVSRISFSGAGWRFPFHLGVCHFLRENELLNKRNLKASGSSAGSVAALCLLLGVDMKKMQNSSLKAAAKINYKYKLLGGNWNDVVVPALQRITNMHKDDDIYKKVNGKLFVNLSRPLWKKELVSEYSNNDHLVDVVLASQYVPTVCQKMPKPTGGRLYFDGSLTDNFPDIGEKTVNVGFSNPLSKVKADIEPSIKSNLLQTFRPDDKIMKDLFKDGFQQAEKFFSK